MLRLRFLLLALTSITAFASTAQLIATLPNAASSKAVQLDAVGNIYLAGSFPPPKPQVSQDTSDAFVAKLSPDGSKLLYFTILSGSFAESVAAIAIGPDGSAYVTGSTGSSDFPVTPGAFQTKFNQAGASQGFLARVNPAGAVVYSSFINGAAFTAATGIALGKAGEVFLTGTGGPGYPINSGQTTQGFVLKLDAAMTTVLLSIYGYGGGRITLDSQGNMYLACTAQPTSAGPSPTLPPLPPGAFQSNHAGAICAAGGGPGGSFGQFCSYQFIAKLDPTGKLVWTTYVTGTYGAIPAGMAVDSAGNVIVAGTTNSDDYPVTPGAFQTVYSAAGPQAPNTTPNFGPPNSSGYATKVSAGGASLIWSTYFGGSSQDQITGMAVAPSGEILLSGRAASNDLVLRDTPDGCRPSPNQVLGFIARLTPDGVSVGATQLIYGVPDCLYVNCSSLATYQGGWPVTLRPDGTAVVGGSNGSVASIDFSATSRLACLTDPADNAQLAGVAPGQLLSVFGTNLAPVVPFTPPGPITQSTDAFGVFFNGIPAPILYSSPQQINVQVPFEIAGSDTVQMRVSNQKVVNPVSETRTLSVVQRQPAIFLSPSALLSPIPGWTLCGSTPAFGEAALALNPDGTINDCTNPAPLGSPVTVFLGGFGAVTPALTTGTIASAPAVPLTPSLDPGPFTGTVVTATQTVPGSITGVAQVEVRPGEQFVLFNGSSLAGVPSRERVILIWAR
jgi:uncharacterized protein (TIGR03437 family)